jgi:hypothetical protein
MIGKGNVAEPATSPETGQPLIALLAEAQAVAAPANQMFGGAIVESVGWLNRHLAVHPSRAASTSPEGRSPC